MSFGGLQVQLHFRSWQTSSKAVHPRMYPNNIALDYRNTLGGISRRRGIRISGSIVCCRKSRAARRTSTCGRLTRDGHGERRAGLQSAINQQEVARAMLRRYAEHWRSLHNGVRATPFEASAVSRAGALIAATGMRYGTKTASALRGCEYTLALNMAFVDVDSCRSSGGQCEAESGTTHLMTTKAMPHRAARITSL